MLFADAYHFVIRKESETMQLNRNDCEKNRIVSRFRGHAFWRKQ